MNVEVVFFYLNNYFIYKNWLLDEILIKFKNRNLMDTEVIFLNKI